MAEKENNVNTKDKPGFQFIINMQYLKDLSFESPKAPQSFRALDPKKMEIKIDVDVKSKPLKDHSEDTYEVDLIIKGEMTVEKEIMFLIEGNYSGVFTLKNVPSDVLDKILLIECPKLLFPFLRSILATNTRDGGFPPLMITPIDFASLYERNKKN